MRQRTPILRSVLAAVLVAGGVPAAVVPDACAFRLVGLATAVAEADGAAARFAVVRDGDPSGPASVRFATEDNTAFAGLDYAAVATNLAFAAGVATNIVEVPVLDNARLHTYSPDTVAPRSFFVRLSDPSDGAALGNPANGMASILDDEMPPRSWFVRSADGGWDAADAADLRTLFSGAVPPLDVLSETTFEEADPAALFSSASTCVFLDFGPRDAAYAASFLAPWRDAIEAWVRSGGRLFVDAMPAEGAIGLPFGLSVDGGIGIDAACYYTFDTLRMAPAPLFGLSEMPLFIAARAGASAAAEAAVVLPDAVRESIRSDGGAVWHTSYEREGLGNWPYLVVSVGAGSVAYASLRPPAQLRATKVDPHMESSADLGDGTAFWERMLYWAFRPDGFAVAATADWAPEGVVGEAGSVAPAAKAFGVYNLGTNDLDVAVTTDVDWLVVESDSATLPVGHMATFCVSLAPEALAFPAGTYTGTVAFASSQPVCEDVDIPGWGSFTYPAPEFRRTVVLAVLPPAGTLAPLEATTAWPPRAHPGATGAEAVVATLSNTSAEYSVRLLGANISGDGAAAFRIVSPASWPVEIPPGGSVDLVVVFAPDAEGFHRATVDIATNDREHPALALALVSRGVPLALEALDVWDGNRGCELVWSSVPGTLYDVLSTDDLRQPFERCKTVYADDGDLTSWIDAREHGAARFYKVRVR